MGLLHSRVNLTQSCCIHSRLELNTSSRIFVWIFVSLVCIFIFFFPEAVISGFWKIISCFQEKNGLVSNFNFTVEPVLTFKARLLQQNCCHFIHNRLTPSKNVYLKNGGENPYLHLGMPPNITMVFQNLGVNTCIL